MASKIHLIPTLHPSAPYRRPFAMKNETVAIRERITFDFGDCWQSPIVPCQRSDRRDWKKLVFTISDPSTSTAKSIRRVEIHVSEPVWVADNGYQSTIAKDIWLEEILDAASSLPNLKCLLVTGLHWESDLTKVARGILGTRFKEVESLQLHDVHFSKNCHAIEFILGLPKLNSLEWNSNPISHQHRLLKNASSAADLFSAIPSQVSGWKLDTLTVTSTNAINPSILWLSKYARSLELLNKDCWGVCPNHIAVETLLHTSGSSLEKLKFDMWMWMDESLKDIQQTIRIPLSNNHRLRSIYFVDYSFSQVVIDVPYMLFTIPSSELSKVVFDIDFMSRRYNKRTLAGLHRHQWGNVDEALRAQQEKQFKPASMMAREEGESSTQSTTSRISLRTVEFRLYRCPYTDNPIIPQLRQSMPWCDRLGLLKFTRVIS